jgi:hypothetical protein
LAEAIILLLDNPRRAVALGEEAQRFIARRFEPSALIDSLRAAYADQTA